MSKFPQGFDNKSIDFAGMQERSVIVNIPKRHDTTLVLSDATLFGLVSNLVPDFEIGRWIKIYANGE